MLFAVWLDLCIVSWINIPNLKKIINENRLGIKITIRHTKFQCITSSGKWIIVRLKVRFL